LKKNLALTGMMGVGKSTIGSTLSKRLLMQFADVDKIIENKLKMTVNEIFNVNGESFFRKQEEQITLQEAKKNNTVISLGGGAFVNTKIRKEILRNTKSFWLDLDLELIEKRLINSQKRPLLDGNNLTKTLEKIYNERKKTYSMADHKINCTGLSVKLITNQIIKIYADN
tara:strand:- start:5468 stop:5977 length:510 start_codon:yes stop_codon:yes gene_type:complete